MRKKEFLRNVLYVCVVAFMFVIATSGIIKHKTLFSNITIKRVYADELSDIEKSKREKEQNLKKLLSEIKSVSNSSYSLNTKIRMLNQKVSEAKKIIKSIDSILKTYQADLKKKNDALDELKKSLSKRSAYFYLETDQDFVVYLLSSNDIGDFMERMTFYSIYYQDFVKKVRQFKHEQDILISKKHEYEREKELLSTQVYEIGKELKNLKAKQAILNAQLRAKYSAKASLVNEIASLSARARRIIEEKAASQGGDSNTGGGGGNQGGGGGGTVDPGHSAGEFVLRNSSGSIIKDNINGPVKFKLSNGGYFKVSPASGRSNYKYRDTLEFRKDTNVYVINELSMENYVKGVGEVPSSWPLESLKVQAVASRTYAIKGLGKRANYKYDMLDNTNDQNYVGVDKEISSYGNKWVSAVNATSGKVIKKGGAVISAYFHSTCGGHTLSTQEVWGGYRSYAVGVGDRYQSGRIWKAYDSASSRSYWSAADRTITKQWLIDLLDATIYLKKNNSSKTAQNNVLSWSFGTIRSKLHQIGETTITEKVGNITSVTQIYNDGNTNIGPHSRKTQTLRIVGDKATYNIDAQVFKLAYNLKSPGHNYIASTLYDVVKHNSNDWKFYSRGWGHRVGMCQYGAYGRAQAGQTYENILKHYYTGVSIGSYNSRRIRIGITKAGGPVTVINATGAFNIVDKNGNTIATIQPNTQVNLERK